MIDNFYLKEAIKKPSPNKNPSLGEVKFIVMHYTASWDVQGVINRFADKNSKVSAHFTIATDGVIYQHVGLNEKAWHAGPSEYMGVSGLNSHSIGIEFVNPGYLKKVDGENYKDAYGNIKTYEQTGGLVEAKNARVGSDTYYWPKYTSKQLVSADLVVANLLKLYPGIVAIVSHEEIDTRGIKTDPGPAFPMSRYTDLLHKGALNYKVTADNLNVRKGPGTGFEIVGKLPQNATVVSTGVTDGDWLMIGVGKWVNSVYLKRV